MKKLISAIVAIGIFCHLNGQSFVLPAYAEVDTSYRSYVNQVFGQLEAN